jgi:cytochrome c2
MSEWSWQRGVLKRFALRAALVLAPLLLADGNAVEAEEKRKPDIEMGARLVEARCAFCHNEKALPELVDRCMAQHGEDYLDEFLKRHHAPDDDARADIIAYLTCAPDLLPLQ